MLQEYIGIHIFYKNNKNYNFYYKKNINYSYSYTNLNSKLYSLILYKNSLNYNNYLTSISSFYEMDLLNSIFFNYNIKKLKFIKKLKIFNMI